jgi:hypothetical protein
MYQALHIFKGLMVSKMPLIFVSGFAKELINWQRVSVALQCVHVIFILRRAVTAGECFF